MSTLVTFAISRLRLGIDGEGVTTLVCGYGCPLDCRYCLNPQCKAKDAARFQNIKPVVHTVESLYDAVRQDALYFEATGGGVTFGGGEPLLQAEFIRDFILYTRKVGHAWRFSLETSLAVPEKSLELLLADDLIDEYIVDIKDMNPEIYLAYTGVPCEKMRANLAVLAGRCPDRVTVRVPRIPSFNTDADTEQSAKELLSMGFTRLDRFVYTIRKGKES